MNDKIIPLHALVLIIQNDYRNSVTEANRLFPSHEIITAENITHDLVGQYDRPDLMSIILMEMKHRINLKLSLGERVVLAAPILTKKEHRVLFAKLAIAQGASVIYIIADQTDTNLITGDNGIAKVAYNKQHLHTILPMSNNHLHVIRSHFRGITIFGDVHGKLEPMNEAIRWAKSRRNFLWFLGDIIDCGSDTLETLVSVYNIVMRGEGAFVLGNHERKIARWLAQQESGDSRSMKLSDGNRVTVNAYRGLTFEQRNQWAGKFRGLLSRASLMSQLGNLTFVHAAVHPDVWKGVNSEQAIEDFALYGEPHVNYRSSEFSLSYNWVDQVPNGKTVFVGHDVRSTLAPMVITGAKGGRVIFLDTGSGKGGFLSTADLRFDEFGNLNLENFNRH